MEVGGNTFSNKEMILKIERLNFDAPEQPYCQALRVGNWVYTAAASIGDPGDDIAVQTVTTLNYLAGVLK